MKKGFTLIELLAVIVILAIIALIAVPIVVNIINDSKKESVQRSIELYIDHVQKVVAKEQMTNSIYNPDRCDIQTNGNVKCYKGETLLKTSKGLDELEIEMNGKKPTEGIITFNNNKINYENVELEGTYFHMDSNGKKETSKEKKTEEPEVATISQTQDYRGYYADVDGDGTPDGVIYADLGANITYPVTGEWGPGFNGQYASDGAYSYAKQTNLKKYTISENKHNGNFGEKEIITLLPGSTGNSRFYVMALEDFTTTDYTKFYWYKNAVDTSTWTGRMSTYATDTSTDFGKGYANTGKIIEIWNKNGTGEGSYTGATQDNRDIFKHIQTKYQERWYIPSRGEWGAFADYFEITSNWDTGDEVENGGNYNSTYGLSEWYWSSSQTSTYHAWIVDFDYGRMYGSFVGNNGCVRLGATF